VVCMSLFKKKTKEEKTLDEIKKKKEQIDKLKEEIVKMGKLILKDGKLTKVEDVKEDVKVAKVPSTELPPIDFTDSNQEMEQMLQQERERMRRQTQQVPPTQARQVPPPLPPAQVQMTQEQYQRMQQQKQMEAFEQRYREEQAELEQQRQQELYQQQMRQQAYAQPQQQMPLVTVTIEMITGSTLALEVTGDKIESFVEALNLAIDNQSSFPLNNKVLNGRNIVSYTLE
jgi:hypothetical protein